jgi:hypothetical protein
MSRVRDDGTWSAPRGGANLRCPQCGGITRVRTTWGAQTSVIRERWCTENEKHRFLSTEEFEAWRSDASVTRNRPFEIKFRVPTPGRVADEV